jgi:dihydroorotase
MATKCGWTPFDGLTVTGHPTATIIRGTTVMRDGEITQSPIGRPITFRS